ncbi:MAG: hypothetical protein OEY09_10435 [Gammaproteobacteria bacterium]|nr:hypothetical protein [Gammaproteobacteria bacterium]
MIKFTNKQMMMLIAAAFILLFMAKQAAAKGIDSLKKSVDITSSDNVASQLADKTTTALTGGKDKSLGGFWQRKCHEKNYEPWYCPSVD